MCLAMQPWQLGDVATWVSAVASVATAILALAAAIVGYRVYKVESGRDARAEQDRRERAADERRSQASLVSAWYGRSAEAGSGFSPWPTYYWGGWIVNASDSPIYDAVVTFYLSGTGKQSTWSGGLIKVLPPYRGEQFVDVGDDAREQLTDEERQNSIEVSLEFRDAAGRRWLRDRNGYLHELAPPRRAEQHD